MAGVVYVFFFMFLLFDNFLAFVNVNALVGMLSTLSVQVVVRVIFGGFALYAADVRRIVVADGERQLTGISHLVDRDVCPVGWKLVLALVVLGTA